MTIPRRAETCEAQADFSRMCPASRIAAMPIYEFVCMQCESHYEELVPMGENADCPDCGSRNVRKQFSVFATHGVESRPSFGGGGGGGCCGGGCGSCG